MKRLILSLSLTAVCFVVIAAIDYDAPRLTFAKTDDAPLVVLYDSKSQSLVDEEKEEEKQQKEKELLENAPSNVVFVGDVEGRPDSSEGSDVPKHSDASGVEKEQVAPMKTGELPQIDVPPFEDDDSCDVLIDERHAYDFSEFPLAIDDRYYHRIYSFHRAFQYLESQGVRVKRYKSNDPISPQTLAKCKTLFMNLPSGDKAPFLVSEIFAIRDFIENGGAFFLITDHTDCYFHQSRLEPLLRELDIEPQRYSVCDEDQSLGSSGSGWILIEKFNDHPVTKGLRKIAFQTGGGVDPRFAVAWSGANSWQDSPVMPIYGETDLAYYGNFTRDPDEPVCSSGVVLAKQQKKGKIVVVGDQNLFSPFFLQYLDVYRLWINSFAWLLDRPEISDPARYVAYAKQGRVLVCWEELARDAKRFGDPDPAGYYHIYTTLCRYYSAFCVADNAPELSSDVAVILNGGNVYSEQGFDFAYRQLKEGRALVVIDPQTDVFDDQDSEVAKLLRNLEEIDGVAANRSSKTNQKYVERVALSNGGKLVLVRGTEPYDNECVPKPEGKLLFVQMENVKILLREIDALFEAADKTRAKSENSEEDEALAVEGYE